MVGESPRMAIRMALCWLERCVPRIFQLTGESIYTRFTNKEHLENILIKCYRNSICFRKNGHPNRIIFRSLLWFTKLAGLIHHYRLNDVEYEIQNHLKQNFILWKIRHSLPISYPGSNRFKGVSLKFALIMDRFKCIDCIIKTLEWSVLEWYKGMNWHYSQLEPQCTVWFISRM